MTSAPKRTSGGWETRLQASGGRVRWVGAGLGALGRVSPTLAGRLAVRLFRKVRSPRRPPRELEWIESASRFTVKFGEGSLAGLSWGEGPAVLLAHGWEGRGSQMGAVGEALAGVGFRAVAYDAPAHGDSSGDQAALWQFSDALDTLVVEQGPFAGFVGHSFGVAAACHSFQRGSLTASDLGSRLVFMAAPDDLRRWVHMLYAMLGLSETVQQAFEATMEEGLGYSWKEACRCTLLAPQDVPLLLVHDREDRDTPLDAAEAVAAAWPQSRMSISSGLGHNRILRDPEVLRGLGEFLSD